MLPRPRIVLNYRPLNFSHRSTCLMLTSLGGAQSSIRWLAFLIVHGRKLELGGPNSALLWGRRCLLTCVESLLRGREGLVGTPCLC